MPARDEHAVPGHVAAPPRGRKPSFKGRGGRRGPSFRGQLLPSVCHHLKEEGKFFALGIIIRDIWVLLSHALFFFFN